MPDYLLHTCVWELTLACCFRCKYCGSRAGAPRPNELTREECLSVAGQLAGLGCRRVALIGGEVFLSPHWFDTAQALSRAGVRVSIVTNGFRFTPERLAQMREAGIADVGVSVDGPQPVHDLFRAPGSYRHAMEAIRALKGAGIPVSVITTLHRANLPFLEELYGILCAAGIGAWQLQACSPMGYAGQNGLDVDFAFADVLAFVARHKDSAPFPLGVADNIGYFTPGESALRGCAQGGRGFPGCQAGISSIGIDSVGNVRGCGSMCDERFVEGNLRSRTLRDIWTDPDAFAYNRRFTPDLLTGCCAECPAGPWCAGGCRAYNWFSTGRLYESPRCARNAPPAAAKTPPARKIPH